MYTYKNGTYNVTITHDGSRIKTGDSFIADHPDNIDCKITNWCDNPICRKYCHEKSDLSGKHGNIQLGIDVLKDLPAGVEIAIGGGATQSHPELPYFLTKLREIGLVPNLTINQYHFNDKQITKLLEWTSKKMYFGTGISYTNKNISNVLPFLKANTNAIWHMIAGINTPEEVLEIIKQSPNKPKILILGYKQFGNGIGYEQIHTKTVAEKIKQWYWRIHEFFKMDIVISFDNLAVQQLNIKRFFDEPTWDQFYQGDDGEASMYIDLVNEQAALSSRSSMRYNMQGKNIKQLFKEVNGH